MNVQGGPWHRRDIHSPVEATDLWHADPEGRDLAHHYVRQGYEWRYSGVQRVHLPSFVVFEWPAKPLHVSFPVRTE